MCLTLQCIVELQPKPLVLTRVGHTLNAWLINHRGDLPASVRVGFGGCAL
jgi:phosphoribosyl 1,2-cyclic phosphate phosphodiesterase